MDGIGQLRRCAVLLPLFLAAGIARAQIGASEADLQKIWGTPLAADPAADGTRTLTFETNNLAIVAVVLEGGVQRIVYSRSGLSEEDVNQLLRFNAQGATWGLFRDTRSEGGLRQTVWIRSDEGAMSVYEANTLTLTTGRWMQWMSQAAQAEAAPAAAAEAAPAESVPAGVHPAAELEGFWQADVADGCAAISCRPDGAFDWQGMSDAGVKEFRARFVAMGAEPPLRFEVWRGTRDREPLGVAVLQADGTLTFSRRSNAAAAGFWPIDRSHELVYRRVSALPRWKTAGPDGLPAVGDTRAQVLNGFGKPKGQMSVGGEEILSYPWGQVILAGGHVTKVKPKAAAPR